MSYKYSFEDLSCEYCKYGRRKCKFSRCPFLQKEAPNLVNDTAFREAIANAEHCETAQKATLLSFQKYGIPGAPV